LWHYALTKAKSESLEAVQKLAIRIIYIPTHGMPYSSMLFYANLSSLASHREDLSCSFFGDIMDPAAYLHSLLPHLDRRLSPHGLDPLKSFQKFILARSATAPSYNMVLIITSIKSNKPTFPITPYIYRLVSVVSLWSPYVIGQTIIYLPCDFYLSSSVFFFFLLFSSPNLSGRRLDVYHTSTHGVALERI